MKNSLPNFTKLLFILSILVLTMDVVGQADSLSLMQKIERVDALMDEDFPKAMASCLELNKLTASSPYTTCRQRSLFLLGKAYWINGEYNKSVDLLKQGVKFAQWVDDFNPLANAINMIGLNFYYQGYYDTAIFYFQQSYDIYRNLNDKAGMARVLGNISLMYHRKGDYQRTVEYLLKGEEVNDELRDEPRTVGDFPGMENIFPDSLYFREEITDNLRALYVHLKNGDQEAANRNYINLGVAYNQLKEYIPAARHYVKACTLQKELGLRPYWNDVAVNYRDANMKDSCFHYHEKARQGFRGATQLSILHTYELLGDAHFHFEQYDSALYNYTIAMRMNMKCNNRITVAGMHRKLSDLYRKLGKFNEAEAHIQLGVILAKEVSIKHQRSLFKSAVELYSEKGDYKKAFYFQTQ
jgi:tetratricopeptide (TPR) repeat protein